MARFFREDFDRNRDFVVAKGFTYGGQGFVSGQPVDKSLFSLRRLRQLYDMRSLELAPTGLVKPVTFGAVTGIEPPKVERYRPKIERRRVGGVNAIAS